MIVADSNLIASLVLESEATESARNLLAADGEWFVPCLWRYEVANIMATLIKAKRLSADTASTLLTDLNESLRAYQRDPLPEDVFDLVAAYGITGYDAQFIALAKELHCTLYTQDRELIEKFPSLAKPFYMCTK